MSYLLSFLDMLYMAYGQLTFGHQYMSEYSKSSSRSKQALKTRVNQHRRPCTNEAQNSTVFLHIKDTGHSFNVSDATILDKEEQWHRRSIKEAIWERVEEPSLNKKGGLRFNLSHAWDRAIKLIPSHLSHEHSSGSVA